MQIVLDKHRRHVAIAYPEIALENSRSDHSLAIEWKSQPQVQGLAHVQGLVQRVSSELGMLMQLADQQKLGSELLESGQTEVSTHYCSE